MRLGASVYRKLHANKHDFYFCWIMSVKQKIIFLAKCHFYQRTTVLICTVLHICVYVYVYRRMHDLLNTKYMLWLSVRSISRIRKVKVKAVKRNSKGSWCETRSQMRFKFFCNLIIVLLSPSSSLAKNVLNTHRLRHW